MKIPAHGLEAFLALARLKSFTKAARQLGLTQSAFSQRIRNLEDILEASLFLRGRAGTTLTGAGEKLLRYAQTQEALEEEYLGNREGAGALRGTIRIGAFSSVVRSLLLPAIAPVLRENPVHCEVITREMGELPGLILGGGVDLVLVNQEIPRAGFIAHFLGFEENVLVRAKKAKNRSDWFLDHNAEDSTTARYFRASAKRSFKRRFFDDVYLLIEAVKLGVGEAVLPKHLLDSELEVQNPGQVLREPVWLIYPEQSYYPKLQQRVIADIQREFKQHLPQK